MYRPALILCALIPLLLAPGRARAAEEDAGADGKITELSELARQFPRHAGPTMLYVNFDGWKDYDGKGHDILPFRAKDGTRGPAIQLILFRTAEMFAPFDVQVRRLRTSGKRDERDRGNTTVFVGSNTATVDAAGKKHINNYTPGRYSDYPGETKGADHRPNSDPFDFAFVEAGQDGKSGWTRDPAALARSIAHEAGHTFGLVHTLTEGTPEIMSYDTINIFFINRAFPISNLNCDAAKGKALPAGNRMYPRWGRRWITRQNSYAYLRAVLGARQADDFASGRIAAPWTPVSATPRRASCARVLPRTGPSSTAAITTRSCCGRKRPGGWRCAWPRPATAHWRRCCSSSTPAVANCSPSPTARPVPTASLGWPSTFAPAALARWWSAPPTAAPPAPTG
jgi:hypothetical protein